MCVCVCVYMGTIYTLVLFVKLRCILCVAGTNVNNHNSNIKTNGMYFYMVNNNTCCSYSDYGCIQVKVHNYFNNC